MYRTIKDLPDEERDGRFAAAVRKMVERLGSSEQLWTEVAPSSCVDGHPEGLSLDALESLAIEETGTDLWDKRDLNGTLDLLTFLYEVASKPTDGWDHSYCGGWHPTDFDSRQGRYDFTVEVNELLGRFRLGLRMRLGTIEQIEPEELEALASTRGDALDGRCRQLIRDSRRLFRSDDRSETVDAILKLVQAYERGKSLLGAGDKKVGAKVVERYLAPDLEYTNDVGSLLKTATAIGHSVFRHEEVDRPAVRNDVDLEFWYFFYLGLCRALDHAASALAQSDELDS